MRGGDCQAALRERPLGQPPAAGRKTFLLRAEKGRRAGKAGKTAGPACNPGEAVLLYSRIMREEKKAYSPDAADGVLIRYEDYLRRIRGLADKTLNQHILLARRMLSVRRRLNNGALDLERLTAGEALDITNILLDVRDSCDWKRSLTTSMRVFLRFLAWDRILPGDLGHVIPSIMRWRLADIPCVLTERQLRRQLETPDRTA